MWRPTQALRAAADADALPRVGELEGLYAYGFLPRRGQILMIAGQPGSQKSGFALWYARRSKVRTLYFSADMDAHTAITRHAAEMSGFTVESVSDAIEEEAIGFFEADLLASNISFCFDSSPTLDDIADELAAYVELNDAYPELVVLDNALNVEAQIGEESAGLRLILKETHRLARETGAAVFVLHHTREEATPRLPQPRSAISGKVSQLPERILTVALDDRDMCFMLAPVKNRGGKQDATGSTFFRLKAKPETATFERWIPPVYFPPPAPVIDWGSEYQ